MGVYYNTMKEIETLKIFSMFLNFKKGLLAYFCTVVIYGIYWLVYLKQAFVNSTGEVFLGGFDRRFTENLQPGPQNIWCIYCAGSYFRV